LEIQVPQPKKTVRTVFVNVGIPEDLVARFELEHYSDLQKRVPMGSWQRFLTSLIREHYQRQDETRAQAAILAAEPIIPGAQKEVFRTRGGALATSPAVAANPPETS
jgi:hypothetical protein